MDGGVLLQRIGDCDFNLIAAIDPDCGTQITAGISLRLAGSSGKELGITGLGFERNRVCQFARIQKIRDALGLRLASRSRGIPKRTHDNGTCADHSGTGEK